MARKYTRRTTIEPVESQVPESPSVPDAVAGSVPESVDSRPVETEVAEHVATFHVTCPALGNTPYVTECGSRAEAESKFREVCLGLGEDAVLSVTEA